MEDLIRLAAEVNSDGGRAYYVGGYVRDTMIGQQFNDIDVVVTGMELTDIATACSNVGINVKLANQNRYPVLIGTVDGYQVEITMPRSGKDSNASQPDATATVDEDAQRRDFTINAMYQDVLTGEVVDPLGGAQHLRDKVLHYVSPHFIEDEQRVLRAAAAISYYDLSPSAQLISHCKSIRNRTVLIAPEVAGKNLMKIASGTAVKRAFAFLIETGFIACYPEINRCLGFEQRSRYHEEELVEHLCMVAQHCADNRLGMEFVLAGLYHDVGKLDTQTFDDSGEAHYVGHEDVSAMKAKVELTGMGVGYKTLNRVLELIQYHMRFTMKATQVSPRFVRRLNADLQCITFQELVEFVRCDKLGRRPQQVDETAGKALDVFRELKEPDTFECYLRGQDLIDLGVSPGPEIGKVLQRAKDAQVNGVFQDREGALAWLRQVVTRPSPRVRVYLDVLEDELVELVGKHGLNPLKSRLRELVLTASQNIWAELKEEANNGEFDS